MNSILKRSLVLAGAVLALGQGAARAADFREMTANVPFPFVVENKITTGRSGTCCSGTTRTGRCC